MSEDGRLYSFGSNSLGQLGIGSYAQKHPSPQIIESLRDVEFIDCGGNHTFCKTLHNEVYCWVK